MPITAGPPVEDLKKPNSGVWSLDIATAGVPLRIEARQHDGRTRARDQADRAELTAYFPVPAALPQLTVERRSTMDRRVKARSVESSVQLETGDADFDGALRITTHAEVSEHQRILAVLEPALRAALVQAPVERLRTGDGCVEIELVADTTMTEPNASLLLGLATGIAARWPALLAPLPPDAEEWAHHLARQQSGWLPDLRSFCCDLGEDMWEGPIFAPHQVVAGGVPETAGGPFPEFEYDWENAPD
ncbi:hypothetical protein [Jatrophihabitans sp. GAS493]|uniref:hypothetical protein n=1 Tax=Jatrophihabitans sp. GAS493 TaxID=1907575 RepID=UPI00155FD78E|nr:hypothetical protein [Jatrophihabitans sp. GAS493]